MSFISMLKCSWWCSTTRNVWTRHLCQLLIPICTHLLTKVIYLEYCDHKNLASTVLAVDIGKLTLTVDIELNFDG